MWMTNAACLAAITLSSHASGIEAPGVGAGKKRLLIHPLNPCQWLSSSVIIETRGQGRDRQTQSRMGPGTEPQCSLRLLRDTPDLELGLGGCLPSWVAPCSA